MKPPLFNSDCWTRTPHVDSDFIEASERFGGTLDLRNVNPDDINTIPSYLSKGLEGTRALCLKPLNIFNEIVTQMSSESINVDRFNSNVKCGYIRNRTPNAYCWKEDQIIYLGVNSGLVQFFFGVISHFLSFQEFMTERLYGSTGEEKGQIDSIKDGIDFESILKWEVGSEYIYPQYRFPKSEDRQLLALNITHLTILYAFLHELGHAYYLHNDFIEKYFGNIVIQEMQSNKRNDRELSNLLNRFELLADIFAIEISLNSKSGSFNSGMADASDFYTWSIGVDLLLFIFSQRLILTTAPGSHPHPQLRILNKVFHLGKKDYGNPPKKITYNDQANMPISKIAILASKDLYEFWKTNELPGWNNSFLSEDTIKFHFESIENLQRKDTEIWLKYEDFVDHDLIKEVVK